MLLINFIYLLLHHVRIISNNTMAFSFSKLFSSVQDKAAVGSQKTSGIDFGSSSIKVVEIESTEKALVLRTYGELQLGPYGNAELGSAVKLDQKKRIEATVDVLRESGVTAKKGVLSIPLSVSFMTVIPLTLRENEDLENRITVEARKYIPLPLSEVALDWSELSGPKKKKQLSTEVMIAAIEHATVKEYKDTLQAIGLASQPSEIEAFSLVRALGQDDDTTLAVIDIGASTSKLYIAREGMIERIHRISIGGLSISKRIAELCNVTIEQAENLKRSYTESGEHANDITKATNSVLEGIMQEFSHLITQYETRNGEKIKRVVLSGGVSAFPGTLPYVREALSRNVMVGNAFDKVAYPAFMEDTLREIAPSFGVSMGAALRLFSEGS
ncbi:MAG: type IV pilus assembly protein PilM [Candidatus Paceibacterota bacterium]